MQELTSLELSALIEDPEHASVEVIAAEALARSGSAAREHHAVARAEPTWARWVAPAPFTVKMRLFCLPYAGGVSENVFARCAFMCTTELRSECARQYVSGLAGCSVVRHPGFWLCVAYLP